MALAADPRFAGRDVGIRLWRRERDRAHLARTPDRNRTRIRPRADRTGGCRSQADRFDAMHPCGPKTVWRPPGDPDRTRRYRHSGGHRSCSTSCPRWRLRQERKLLVPGPDSRADRPDRNRRGNAAQLGRLLLRLGTASVLASSGAVLGTTGTVDRRLRERPQMARRPKSNPPHPA
jgi:hypothetical protein